MSETVASTRTAASTRTVASIIAGEVRTDAPGGRLESVNPADRSELVGEILLTDADGFVDAARAARAAQRGWAAVPKPLNSVPSTARSRSASGITTSGFLPPSSRQGDWTWRPQSSPILDPTADEPVKPTLSTRRSSRARSRPSNADGPSH